MMAAPRSKSEWAGQWDDLPSFPVTVRTEIGRVTVGKGDEKNPAVVAFEIIARHGADGTYEFIGPDENTTTRVTVEWAVPDGT
jgi:hypothetical protein